MEEPRKPSAYAFNMTVLIMLQKKTSYCVIIVANEEHAKFALEEIVKQGYTNKKNINGFSSFY